MKRFVFAILACSLLLCALGAQAGVYTFTPSDADLADLPHENFFTWGIQWNTPTGEIVTGASITYKKIWDWTGETNHLYTTLLNTVTDTNGGTSPNWTQATGYKRYTKVQNDSQGGGNNFAGKGVLLGNWTDPRGGHNGLYAIDLSYNLPAANLSWLEDGNFGFGIDPDCHYYNCGVEVKVTTMSKPSSPAVPDASAVMLGSLGLSTVVGFARRRRK